jgi:hypothetical protein
MQLCGARVSTADCRTLVDLLGRVGPADDLELAGRIDRGIENETVILALSPAECDTLLGVLDDSPEGSLSQLRGRLLKKHNARRSRVVESRDHNFNLIETRYGTRTPVNEPEPVERCANCGAMLTDDTIETAQIDAQAGGHRIYSRSCAACGHEIDTFRQGFSST